MKCGRRHISELQRGPDLESEAADADGTHQARGIYCATRPPAPVSRTAADAHRVAGAQAEKSPGPQEVASEMYACRVAPLARTMSTVLRGCVAMTRDGQVPREADAGSGHAYISGSNAVRE